MFHPWFKFYFSFALGYGLLMFDNEFGTKKNKKPKIKSTAIYNLYHPLKCKNDFQRFLIQA